MTTIRLLTKSQLKAERLKPAPGQQFAARYWQGMGWVYQYDASEAIPMRPYRPSTPAQATALAAGRALVGTEPCGGCGQRIDRVALNRTGNCYDCANRFYAAEQDEYWQATCHGAAQLLALNPLFIDTETTGLDSESEIIEIAVLDRDGNALLETLVKPMKEVPPEATAIHGLGNAELMNAPTWPDVTRQLTGLLYGRVLIAHNAEFDMRMVEQSSRRHGLPPPASDRWTCTMEMLTHANDGRWPNLNLAMSIAGVVGPGLPTSRPHRAAYDADCCRRIVLALASIQSHE
jgi:DNA polymerase-3 subunit epsilon